MTKAVVPLSGEPLGMSSADEDLARLHLDDAAADGPAEPTGGRGGYGYESAEEQKAIAAQRSAIWAWIRGLGLHLLKDGLSLTTVSMPVTLFEARSWTQRVCDNWSYLHLLELAAQETDAASRLRLVVAFAIGGLRRQVGFLKPFNPLLGETFAGTYACGASVAVEQVSHHPPVTAWELRGSHGRYVYSGSGAWHASARGNTVRGSQSGEHCVVFAADGARVTWSLPELTVHGALWGRRSLEYDGKVCFEDHLHRLRVDVTINEAGPGLFKSIFKRGIARTKVHDAVKGDLVRLPDDGVAAASSTSSVSTAASSASSAKPQVLDTLSGSWLTRLEWAHGLGHGQLHVVWDAKRAPISGLAPSDRCLPSDARLRKDLVRLAEGRLEEAQAEKVALEQAQRADRKLRKAGGGPDS
ncbi:oxysterol-binding protein [Helicosporidium sp. ATCC 50920]|nr:oxysterol-binding protein [Helicosporidium sp. ATCC 50920]|eukprot:KDD75842.1 oxysterol-binding protein [Helicosporidium sp. ATCC 50920]